MLVRREDSAELGLFFTEGIFGKVASARSAEACLLRRTEGVWTLPPSLLGFSGIGARIGTTGSGVRSGVLSGFGD